MEHVHVFDTPKLRNPVLVASFAGWNDAAHSATSAARFLLRRWSGQRLAEIEAEEFFDFTDTRPTTRIVEGSLRKIDWPGTELYYCQGGAEDRDLILLLGTEPQLRWKTFVDTLLGLCRQFGVATVVTLGALLAEVPHTVPVRVHGYSNDPALAARLRRLDANPSNYEGPTGIVGVLNAVAHEHGLRTASIWGSVPMYLSAIPNPQVTLAILKRLGGLLDLNIGSHLRELEDTAKQFERQVQEGVANNPQIAAYLQQLEERERQGGEAGDEPSDKKGEGSREGRDLPSGKSIVEDIEEFLRRMQNERGGEG